MPRNVNKSIKSYDHNGSERLNNPPVGLVYSKTNLEANSKVFSHTPNKTNEHGTHLALELNWTKESEAQPPAPELAWAEKEKRGAFTVPPVSLHVHERIDPCSIIEAVQKPEITLRQPSLFEFDEEKLHLRKISDFRKGIGWSNRLIAGDSLLVMNSLLERENLGGRVQMIYIDPPCGIEYGSNFQPFVQQQKVRDGKAEHLTREPETIKAFRDTWKLDIHSYLSYLRDRLVLARELLSKSGSCFVQIGNENVHRVALMMDEIFGANNRVTTITCTSTRSSSTKYLDEVGSYLLWYAKEKSKAKYHQLYEKLNRSEIIERFTNSYGYVELPIRWKLHEDEVPDLKINNTWDITMSSSDKRYVVQTSRSVIQRCMLMTTDPGDLVLDPTCGSGTTAHVAEQWGRRWITCDTSRVALNIARQRLMTATFDYYTLARPYKGVGGGFKYKKVPKISAAILAYDEPTQFTTLYDQPEKDSEKHRVTGPFTVEAVTSPTVPRLDSNRIEDWINELFASGIRGKAGQRIKFSRLEPLLSPYLAAVGEALPESPYTSAELTREFEDVLRERIFSYRVAVVFGPEHAPLGQKQVERAMKEAEMCFPQPDLLLFAAFQFDPDAAKEIDEANWPGTTLLRVEMNTDLLTEDLKKGRTSNENFWLVGQPEIGIQALYSGEYQVSVLGFDYFSLDFDKPISNGLHQIAVWLLDTDYDGHSLFPRQVFFPMGKRKHSWGRLAKKLRSSIDPELIKAYEGYTSLPFRSGECNKIAVKIVDYRGIESLIVRNLSY